MITSSDLVERRAALDSFAGRYLTIDRPFKRLIVLAKVGAGELLPLSALSTDVENLQSSAVPVSFLSSDLPANLLTGEIVTLYQVGDPRLAGTVVAPALILNSVAILGIDRKGENLGSSVSLTLSVKKVDVLRLLTATSSGRLVAVRMNG